jgi:pimeloyl-ACP methyl ester carboxylesterase
MTFRKLILLMTIVALILADCNAQPAPAPGQSTGSPATPTPAGNKNFEKTDCWFKAPLGRDVECGWLTVPEDHAKPDGKTIKLAVARFKSDAANPEPDPVIYLEGGPGGSALHSEAIQFDLLFGPLAAHRDVILFDQRGTGYSVPNLGCPEEKKFALDTLDQNLTPEKSAELSSQAAAQCHDRLVKEGVGLALYNSAQNAADVDALRQALGYDKVNLYGTSYGTRLALTTMRDFPQGLRSVVIDGVVPLQEDTYARTPANGAQALAAVFKACEADAACNQNYPNLPQVLSDLKAKLDKDPIKFNVTLHSGEKKEALLNGDGLIGTLFQGLYVTALLPSFPRMIYDVRAGNYDMLAGLTSLVLSQLDDISYGMHFSVQCQEEVPFTNSGELDAFLKQNPEYATLGQKDVLKACKVWNVPASPVKENQSVTSDIPTLVISSEFDPITPPAYGQEAAQTLSKSFVFEVPNASHGSSITEDCPRSMVTAFIDNPTQKPDAACFADMAQMKFAAPVNAADFKLKPFTATQYGLSSVAPENWKQVQAGVYSPSGKVTDPTALIMMAAPIAPEMFLNLMQQQLSQSNYKIEFSPAGTRTANGIEWTLYQTNADTSSIDLALGQKAGTTYLIMMQSPLNDRKALMEGVFVPAVDALQSTK